MRECPKMNQLVFGTQADFSETEKFTELYDFMCKYQPEEYPALLQEYGDSILLYQLSPMRKHLLEWYEIPQGARVLELGAQSGILTELFLEKGAVVDAIEPVKILTKCNQKRNENRQGLSLFHGYLECACKEWEQLQPESYDYIVLAGSLTDTRALMGRKASQQEVLELVFNYLKPQGKLLVAMENRFGLKYWAGCKEELTGQYFAGIQGLSGKENGPRSKKELEELLEKSGYGALQFYYPYPDAVFPTMLYSDDYLPKQGELRINIRNFDTERFVLFDERKVYDTLVEEQSYPQYANAFLVIAQKGKCK